jgi:hypothetical protein
MQASFYVEEIAYVTGLEIKIHDADFALLSCLAGFETDGRLNYEGGVANATGTRNVRDGDRLWSRGWRGVLSG